MGQCCLFLPFFYRGSPPTYFVEVPLQKELLENTDELLKRGELPPVQLHQLHRLQPIGHVEADVHLYLGALISQLYDWHTCLVKHLERMAILNKKVRGRAILFVRIFQFVKNVYCMIKLKIRMTTRVH